MHVIAVLILGFIFVQLVLGIAADVLNLKHLETELPREFKDVYDDERYNRSQQYLKINTRFGWITGGFDLVLMIVFWFAGGFAWLDNLARGFGYGPIVTGVIYIGILMLAKTAISLPFGVYDTFVIEERFGFNKTTWKTFAADLVKGLLLSFALGIPLLAGILAFFEYAGSYAWLACWITVTCYMLIIQFIAPTWIMPLFNKFDPLEDGELKSAIFDYARSVRFSLQNVFVMDGSKRSAKSNAFFTGFGKNKRIALYDTLIARHTTSELVSVLAHEIGHFQKKHIIKAMIMGIVQAGLMFYLLSLCLSYDGLFAAFYVEEKSVYAGMIFFGLLFSPLDFFLSIIGSMISRKNEYEADRFAVETAQNPDAMVSALKKLSAHNLSNLTPHPLYVFLNYSHPPVLSRLKGIKGN